MDMQQVEEVQQIEPHVYLQNYIVGTIQVMFQVTVTIMIGFMTVQIINGH